MIPGQVMFGLHTAELRKWVTRKESNAVKSFFGLEPDEKLTDEMYFYDSGITKLWIQEVPGKTKPRHYIHMIVNFTRASGSSSYAAMPYTLSNVRKVFNAVNKVLELLHLSEGNRKLQDWTVARFDSTFDVYVEHPALFMWLLNHALNLGDKKKQCRRIPVRADGKTPGQLMRESMRFGNASYTYNIYAKLPEVAAKKKGRTIEPEEIRETENLLRVERQNLANACKKLLPDGKAGDLAKAGVREEILKTMTGEMGVFFGRGDFYSWDGIQKNYFPEHKAEIKEVLPVMVQITKTSLEASQGAVTKETADVFERLGLAPAGIPPDYSTDFIQGIYHRVTAAYPEQPEKRKYGRFPRPHKTGDGRYKSTITLYRADGTRKQVSVAGRTMEDYEQKVFEKLRGTYAENLIYLNGNSTAQPDCCLKSADSICRFSKAAKTKGARENAERFIEQSGLSGKKRCHPALTAAEQLRTAGQP